jgi:hypothetical protein
MIFSEPQNPKSMTRKSSILLAATVAMSSLSSMAQPIGLWDFNSGDLSGTVGGPLTYLDAATQAGVTFGTTTTFGIPDIGGTAAKVAKINGFVTPSGIGMPIASDANGGGSTVNQWTIIYDLLSPTTSDGKWRALIETDGRIITADADFFINPGDGIGISSAYDGKILPNTWYRVAFAVDSAAGIIRKYINGALVGIQSEGDAPEGGLDGRWTLSAQRTAELFDDNDGDVAPLYVNSVSLWNRVLNPGEIQALGGPSAAGIPQTIGPVPAFLESTTPLAGATGVAFQPAINVVLNPGSSTVTQASLKLLLDDAVVPATIAPSGANFTFDFTVTDFLAPNALHTVGVVYSENGTLKTNSFSFTVANYQKITLPAPFLTENFDEVTEGLIPDGWTRTNHTEVVADHDLQDLDDLNSDSYQDWLVASVDRLTALKSRIFNLGTIVVNGTQIDGLGHGNILYAESDVRDGSQVQMVFSKDYDLTGKKNVFIAFNSLYEQNQDNINSFEYSIDGGATWLPGLYLINQFNGGGSLPTSQGDVFFNPDGTIDAVKTLNTIQGDTAYGTSYGAYIGAPITQALAPYISGRSNQDEGHDPLESKRIEVIRLFQADNQPKVRLRFMQAGTGSWYWGIDDIGFYEIPAPRVIFDPNSLTVNYGANATFQVTASGDATLTYQWYHDDVLIQGANAATYTVTGATAPSSGKYTVKVTNNLGSATSQPATLTVLLAPVINTQPQAVLATAGAPISLSVAVGGQSPFTYVWKKDGQVVPNQTSANLAIATSVVADSGSYTVTISNDAGTATSNPVKVTILPVTPITQDLVVHLPFDADSNDTSGRGNNGTPEVQPEITNGTLPAYDATVKLIGGGAIHITDGQDIAMGTPTDLNFGSDVNFTFSFWVRGLDATAWTGDPSFIGNKDWDSGGNLGYVVAAQGGGSWKWNWKDDSPHQYDVGGFPSLTDGSWHNVLISHDRAGLAYFYVDGVLTKTIAFAGLGNIDTAGVGNDVGTFIGQDGTGRYGFDRDQGAHFKSMWLDDFGVWRRLLTPQEAASIYAHGKNGEDLTKAGGTVTQQLKVASVESIDGQLHITATGASPTARLEKATSLGVGVQWQDVGPLSGLPPISTTQGTAFFRIVNP